MATTSTISGGRYLPRVLTLGFALGALDKIDSWPLMLPTASTMPTRQTDHDRRQVCVRCPGQPCELTAVDRPLMDLMPSEHRGCKSTVVSQASPSIGNWVPADFSDPPTTR